MDSLCVYQHRRSDSGAVFYVGKGPVSRSTDLRSRNAHWRAIVARFGHSVEIVCDGLDDERALALEIMLIQFYGRRDLGTGSLVNMTDGGDGVRGRIMPPVSVETRSKKSAALKGRKKSPEHIAKCAASLRGRVIPVAQRAAVSAALKGRPQSPEHVAKRAAAITGEKSPMWGKTLSLETRAKISVASKGRRLTQEWAANISAGKRGEIRADSSSGLAGVSASGLRWRARITDANGRRFSLGLHRTKEDAARAYDLAAVRMLGPAARLNYPISTMQDCGHAASQ